MKLLNFKNWIIKSNTWYDDIKEPFKFLFAIGLVAAPLILVSIFCEWVSISDTGFIWPWIFALMVWRIIGSELKRNNLNL